MDVPPSRGGRSQRRAGASARFFTLERLTELAGWPPEPADYAVWAGPFAEPPFERQKLPAAGRAIRPPSALPRQARRKRPVTAPSAPRWLLFDAAAVVHGMGCKTRSLCPNQYDG